MAPNKSLIYKAQTPYTPVPGEHLAVEDRTFEPGDLVLALTVGAAAD